MLSVLALLATCSAAAAFTPREGQYYSLLSSEGTLLAVGDNGISMLATADDSLAEQHKFEFVRADGDLVYLRFGDYMLSAFDHDGEASPQFRLYTRTEDGKVALLVHGEGGANKGLHVAGRSIEQRHVVDWASTDESMWWTLLPSTDAAAEKCPAGRPPRLDSPRRRFRLLGRDAASGTRVVSVHSQRPSTTSTRVFAQSAALVAASTAVLLPAGSFAGLGAALASAVPAGALAPLSALSVRLQALVPTPLRGALTAGWRGAVGAAAALRRMMLHHQLAFVLAHGLLTDGAADAMAQALSHSRKHEGASGHPSVDAGSASLVLDWRRVHRSAWISFLTDDLPFAIWAKALWDGFETLRPAIATSTLLPPWLAAPLSSPLGMAFLKTLATQVGYESLSTAAYLGAQEVARGGGMRGVARELRAKFWKTWRSGFAFFSAAQLLMFLVPVWWVQPLLDNLACLAFNTYLAMVSYDQTGTSDDSDATVEDLPSPSTSQPGARSTNGRWALL